MTNKTLLESIIQTLKNDPEFARKVLPYTKGGTSPEDIANRIAQAFSTPEVRNSLMAELQKNPELLKGLQKSSSLRAPVIGQRKKEVIPTNVPATRPSIEPGTNPSVQQQKQPPPLPKKFTSLNGIETQGLGAFALLAQNNQIFPEKMLVGILNKDPNEMKNFKNVINKIYNKQIKFNSFTRIVFAVQQLAEKGLIDKQFFDNLTTVAQAKNLIEEEIVRLFEMIF